MVLNVPNILTIARMVMTVFFFSAGLQGEWVWALILFFAAAFSDMVDGTIARILNQKTEVGAFLDPIADKLMMFGGVTLLTVNSILPWWLMALVVGRDLMIVVGLFYLIVKKVETEFRPIILSKLTTLFQILTIVLGLATVLSREVPMPWYLEKVLGQLPVVILVTAALTVVSGVQYVMIGLRMLRKYEN